MPAVLGRLLQPLDQLVAVHAGHAVVADQQIGRVVYGFQQGVGGVAGGGDRGQRLQGAVQQSEDHGIVVHQQDFDVIRHGRLGLLADAGVVAALASGFVLEHDLPDFDSLVQRFTHIVHGQRGDAGRDQGFHLDARNRRGDNF